MSSNTKFTTGFDPGVVKRSISGIMSARSELMDALAIKMQSKFVDEMGKIWAAEQAQDFFAKFKEAMDGLIKKSDETMESVVNTMNQGATNWARELETTYVPTTYTKFPKKIAVDGIIVNNINGAKGINESEAVSTADLLSVLSSNAESALQKATAAVKDCGFISAEESADLANSLSEIKTSISEKFGSLITDAQNGIKNTVSKYGEIKTSNASTFQAK